jgi:hypothetical protein
MMKELSRWNLKLRKQAHGQEKQQPFKDEADLVVYATGVSSLLQSYRR